MHYPWWHIPFLTSPMLIAGIATLHAFVAHYAVGGGLFLAVETAYARRTGDRAYLAYLRSHARFFILVTVVYGAVTGVGIWWTIGLASPLATEMLIHVFVFGWAMEYVAFIVEILSAFIFYYGWERLRPRAHIAMGWIYGVSAWMSLVLITGITAFMLHPGGWIESRDFWIGFFNPQFLPQALARTGGALLLASLYVYLHSSLKARDPSVRRLIARRSTRPALLGALLVIAGGLAWYAELPPSAGAALAAASSLNLLMVLIFALTVIVFFMLYLGPYRNPEWLSPGFAILLFICGLGAFTSGEFIREAVRKPYVIYNVVMSNGIYPDELAELRRTGYLKGGAWTRAWVLERYPRALARGGGTPEIDERALLELPPKERRGLGQVLFQYHCNSCHAAESGFSAAAHLARGWTREMIHEMVEHPERYHFFMPPWAGTEAEAELLTEYLVAIAPPAPPGMAPAR